MSFLVLQTIGTDTAARDKFYDRKKKTNERWVGSKTNPNYTILSLTTYSTNANDSEVST